MFVRLLGPVEVADGAGWSNAGSPKQSCVLAALALAEGKPLGHDALAHRVWGPTPPESARNVVYGHITRLRALLRDLPGAELARADANGYRLVLPPAGLDAFVARHTAARARDLAASGDQAAAAEQWRLAAGLWRGPALAGVEGGWAQRIREQWDQTRIEVLIGRYEAELNLGNHAGILDELTDQVERRPLSEPLVGQLMLALYRTDRPNDALGLFQRTRARLRDELGNDPTARLATLQQRILRHDPELRHTPAHTESAGTALPRPAQLPPDTTGFVGRDRQLAELTALARDGDSTVLAAIDGMAGIGKTGFAVRLASRLRDDYPDGQLFIDLHGHSGYRAPLTPAHTLLRLLRSLGFRDADIGDSVDERSAVFRSAVAGKRLIILLDNAANERQVRPLLPGPSQCLVLVTGRRRLVGLDDAHLVSLDVLSGPEAIELFRRVSGADPAPSTAAAIIDLCGRLPLAIRIAAMRLRRNPHGTAERLHDELSDRRTALARLDIGERSVAAAFDSSVHDLTEPQRDLFDLLGQVPGPDFDAEAVSAMAGIGTGEAESILDELADRQLLNRPRLDRFGFHDLVRLYAQRRSSLEPADQRRLRGRLGAHYLARAESAVRQLTSTPDDPDYASPDAARDWLGTERENLLAVIEATSKHGPRSLAWRLSTTIGEHYLTSGDHLASQQAAEAGLTAAETAADPAAQARMLRMLGDCTAAAARHPEALSQLSRALELARGAGDRAIESDILMGMSGVQYILGDLGAAADLGGQSLDVGREAGIDPHPGPLNNLGVIAIDSGRLREAVEYLTEAVALEERRPTGKLYVPQCSLSLAYTALGELAAAEKYARQGLENCRRSRAHKFEPYQLLALARMALASGNDAEAHRLSRVALDAALAADVGMVVPVCLTTMAQTLLSAPDQALRAAREALRRATSVGFNVERAEAGTVIAEALHRLGRPGDARRYAIVVVEFARKRQYRVIEGWALTVLAEIRFASGAPEEGRRIAEQAMECHTETGYAVGLARTRALLG